MYTYVRVDGYHGSNDYQSKDVVEDEGSIGSHMRSGSEKSGVVEWRIKHE